MAIAPVSLSPRRAARVAYFAAVANLVAGLMMALALRKGLPIAGNPFDDRIAFVREHATLWRAGWSSWHVAAVGLVLLMLVLASRFRGRAPVRAALAAVLAVAGLAADLAAEAIAMGVSPAVESRDFLLVESMYGVLTGYLANGLYTAAGILLTWAGARELPRAVLALGVPVWGAGLWLSAASLTHSAVGQLWSTAVLIPLFVLWAALVGQWLKRSGS
jgi:hypothetical protein